MTARGQVSLARASLRHEWRRYLTAILAVAFSGLLILVQIGLLIGMFSTVSVIVDQADADLWVIDSTTRSFDMPRNMPPQYEFRLRSHPDVVSVQTMSLAGGEWRSPTGGKTTVILAGVSTTDNSLSLPRIFSAADRAALRELGSVIIDEADLEKLGVQLGSRAEINGRQVRVVGVTHGMRAIGGAYIFASDETTALLTEAGRDDVPYYLLRIRTPERRDDILASLQTLARADEFKVVTPEDFSISSQLYWLTESGAGAGFFFAVGIATLVGIAITSQTLRGAVLASIREYATLRALGTPVSALRRVVLEQAFWIGLLGQGVSAALAALVWWLAQQASVPIDYPWWALLGTALFSLTIALLSGLLSLAPLYRTEPAELLR